MPLFARVPLPMGKHIAASYLLAFFFLQKAVTFCCVTNHSPKCSGLNSNHLLIPMILWFGWEVFFICVNSAHLCWACSYFYDILAH